MTSILSRELVLSSRQKGMYMGRAWAVLLGLLLLTGFYLSSSGQFTRFVFQGGVFPVIAIVAFYAVLLSGFSRTCDCISLEVREGTLGLLLLTSLKPYQIVLGKLFSETLRAFFGLIAILPLLAIPVLAGGTSASELCRVALALFVGLLLSASIGLVGSVSCLTAQAATNMAFRLLVLLAGVLPAIEWSANRWLGGGPLAGWARDLTPVRMIKLSFETSYTVIPGDYWRVVLLNVVYSLLCLAYVTCCLRGAAFNLLSRPLPRRDAIRVEPKRVRNANPYTWLILRTPLRPYFDWLALLALYLVVAWLTRNAKPGTHENLRLVLLFCFCVTLTLLYKTRVATTCSGRLAADKESSTLELVLSTPISLREILAGHWMAILKNLGWYLAGLVLLHGLLAWMAWPALREYTQMAVEANESGASHWLPMLAMVFLGNLLLLALETPAILYTAVWSAVRSRKASQAAGLPLSILYLPALGMMITAVALNLLGISAGRNPFFYPNLWLGLSILNAVGWALWSRVHYLKKTRLVVSERFQGAT